MKREPRRGGLFVPPTTKPAEPGDLAALQAAVDLLPRDPAARLAVLAADVRTILDGLGPPRWVGPWADAPTPGDRARALLREALGFLRVADARLHDGDLADALDFAFMAGERRAAALATLEGEDRADIGLLVRNGGTRGAESLHDDKKSYLAIREELDAELVADGITAKKTRAKMIAERSGESVETIISWLKRKKV